MSVGFDLPTQKLNRALTSSKEFSISFVILLICKNVKNRDQNSNLKDKNEHSIGFEFLNFDFSASAGLICYFLLLRPYFKIDS